MNASLHSISDGSGTLADALRVAIFDYQRAFGREPKLIRVPFWRGQEMGRKFVEDACQNPNMTFRGIPFRFVITSDLIELSRP